MSHLRLEILSQVLLESISTMEQRDIKAALFTCEFTERRHGDFIVDTEHFNRWESFTLVDFDAFATLGQIWLSDLILADKNAPRPHLQKGTFPFWLSSCRRHPGPGNQHRLHFLKLARNLHHMIGNVISNDHVTIGRDLNFSMLTLLSN